LKFLPLDEKTGVIDLDKLKISTYTEEESIILFDKGILDELVLDTMTGEMADSID
jgi:hypothetical protein